MSSNQIEANKEESSSNIQLDEKQKRLKELRAQIEQIKQQIVDTTETRKVSDIRKADQEPDTKSNHETTQIPTTSSSNNDLNNLAPIKIPPKEIKRRQKETIELVKNFKRKLKEVSKDEKDSIKCDDPDTDQYDSLDLVDGDQWMRHKFITPDDGDESFGEQINSKLTETDEIDRRTKRHKYDDDDDDDVDIRKSDRRGDRSRHREPRTSGGYRDRYEHRSNRDHRPGSSSRSHSRRHRQ